MVLLTCGRYALWSLLAAANGSYDLDCPVDVLEGVAIGLKSGLVVVWQPG